MGTRYRNSLAEHRLRFITTTCNDWLHLFINVTCYKILSGSMNFVNKKYNVHTLAYVFMPNHIHLVLLFEDGEVISAYMRDFKKFTAGEIRREIERQGRVDLLKKIIYKKRVQVYKVWQDRFDDFYILNEKTFLTKMNYIHQNPVRKGLCKSISDHTYSSARFYFKDEETDVKMVHYSELIMHA